MRFCSEYELKLSEIQIFVIKLDLSSNFRSIEAFTTQVGLFFKISVHLDASESEKFFSKTIQTTNIQISKLKTHFE